MSFVLDKCQTFVETGTYRGATIGQVALNYPNMECYSCEPDKQRYEFSVNMVNGMKNAFITNCISVPFMLKLNHDGVLKRSPIMFYLDAHGYGFQWDLQKEVEIATSQCPGGFIVVDDFQVPTDKKFGFDCYNGMICNFNYIKGHIKAKHRLYYPCYTENTSNLKSPRGWCIITFGTAVDFDLSQMNHIVKEHPI
jgi:hypothetical protein